VEARPDCRLALCDLNAARPAFENALDLIETARDTKQIAGNRPTCPHT
jgi:hypothetical protein